MDVLAICLWGAALAPAVLMAGVVAAVSMRRMPADAAWRLFAGLSGGALVLALLSGLLQAYLRAAGHMPGSLMSALALTPIEAWIAPLVQFLGTVIGMFSSRYLQGEHRQSCFVTALAGVLMSVQLLLLADHWVVLILAWALAGMLLQRLLRFYPDRPFALLAAHKKFIADRVADLLLVVAAGLAWTEVGSGSISAVQAYLDVHGSAVSLQASAACLALAVILRTALFPVHGWLVQVMEAPTPVSALLHAGVVNLGGFVLIRFAPLLGAAPAARWLLVMCGLGTAVLAGLVMLTRVSIKVRLAWSTVAQMGFMILECGLGLYSLAALHLIGHSLYKAHAFLAASNVVRQSKWQRMRGRAEASSTSIVVAPAVSVALVALVQYVIPGAGWPWWWCAVLALAWAPLLWLPSPNAGEFGLICSRLLAGLGMVAGLTALAQLAHFLPFGVEDAADASAGWVALLGMSALYFCLAALQRRSGWLSTFRRSSYAGFYVDEVYTRLALKWWPTSWGTDASSQEPARGLPDFRVRNELKSCRRI